MKTTFIYALCEPGTRTVRYIGKTNDLNRRFKEHLCISIRKKTHLGYWLKEIVSQGAVPEMIKLREVPGNGSDAERRYIRFARGCKMDLVNLTEGGDGAGQGEENHFFGHTHLEKALVKMRGPKSESHKQNMRKPKSTTIKMCKPKTEAHRKALSMPAHFSHQGRKRIFGADSKYIGVTWMPTRGKWRARIKCHNKEFHLGVFASETEAARAYNLAAIKYFGGSARCNFFIP